MKNIIIFGPPGTGKGTMSKKLSDEFNLRHISTGDIIRKNQELGTKIGVLADRIVDGGGLLPDDVVNEMIKQEIIDDKDSCGFIFDGFPRTSGQAKMLDQFLHKRGTPITIVIHLDVAEWVARQRIIKRGETSLRKDDTLEVFPTRWNAYTVDTIPAINYFEGRGKVSVIDAHRSIEDVYADVRVAIG